MPTFDRQDGEIRAIRIALFDKIDGPRTGDWVEFTDGVVRRISYLSRHGAQTSTDEASFLLTDGGHISMSGQLFPSVPLSSLECVKGQTKEGRVWFFHHNRAEAGNDVHTVIPFRVYRCSLPAPI